MTDKHIDLKILYVNGKAYFPLAELITFLNFNGNNTDVEKFVKTLIPKLIEPNENH